MTLNRREALWHLRLPASWNTASNYLVLVAGNPTGTGLTIQNNAVFQGAAYVVANYLLGTTVRCGAP